MVRTRSVLLAAGLALGLSLGACRLGFDEVTPGDLTGDGGGGDGGAAGAPRSLSLSRTGACAVLGDGTLWCWGDNAHLALGVETRDFVRPTQVGTDTDWAEIATSPDHSCATKTTGTLWCWGEGATGFLGTGSMVDQPVPVQVGTATDWSQPAVGLLGGCALRAGVPHCWGANAWGFVGDGSALPQLSPVPVGVPTGTVFTRITTGGYHACGVSTDGVGWCWGYGGYGAIGVEPAISDNPFPVRVGTERWTTLEASGDLTCAIRSDGTLWVWGLYVSATPLQIGTATDHTAVACGGPFDIPRHVCALRGTALWCAGFDNQGQLGAMRGGRGALDEPVAIEPGRVFTRVVAAEGTTCAVRDDEVVCTGAGSSGQLGDGVERWATTPHPVSGTWAELDTGANFVAAVSTDGAMWGWGNNTSDQLSDDLWQGTHAPIAISTTADWTRVRTTNAGALGLKGDGSIWRFGANPTTDYGWNLYHPAVPIGAATWLATDGGDNHDCGIQTDGEVWCWGVNREGQIGTGDLTFVAAPVKVSPANSVFTDISAGGSSTCAIRDDGTRWCWGSNGTGTLGDGTTMARLVPTQIGADTTWATVSVGLARGCGVRTNGTLWCWGDAPGDGSAATRLDPVPIGTASWQQVSVGRDHTCGVQVDGTLWCWGQNTTGELGTGLRTAQLAPVRVGAGTSWRTVRAGSAFTCALDTAGAAACWGDGRAGQLGDGLGWVTAFQPIVR